MLSKKQSMMAGLCLLVAGAVWADDTLTISMHKVAAKGSGAAIGTITATDTDHGLLLTPNLSKLSPGVHGFHVHEKSSCDDKGMAAGDHVDPDHTGKHAGPYSKEGHTGDLPALTVDKNGKATLPVLAPRLKVSDLKDHALVIHTGGDNYSDTPKLGGGDGRFACGVVGEEHAKDKDEHDKDKKE
jgi:superoxide dismutase, Cu-Zn family